MERLIQLQYGPVLVKHSNGLLAVEIKETKNSIAISVPNGRMVILPRAANLVYITEADAGWLK